jgi:hypothetical protein
MESKGEAIRPRPDIGATTSGEIRIEVCLACGFAMDDTGLCSDTCGYDGDVRPKGKVLYAIYQRTEVLVREEDEDGNIIRGPG